MADYRILIPFIKKSEGGLSRAVTDSASKNPSPCIYKGLTGWHTNKGITWSTYQTYKTRRGFKTNCDEFILMPDELWKDIYKSMYWDAWKLDEVKYQALANVIVSWAWGSGNTGAWNLLRKFAREKLGIELPNTSNQNQRADIVLQLVNQIEPNKVKILFDMLTDYRQNFFISLNQPANLQGWLNRLQKFRDFNEPFLMDKDNSGKLLWIALIFGFFIFARQKFNL